MNAAVTSAAPRTKSKHPATPSSTFRASTDGVGLEMPKLRAVSWLRATSLITILALVTPPPLSVVTHLVGIMRQLLSNPLDCSSSNVYKSPVPRSDKFWISFLIPKRVLSPDNSFNVVSSTEDSGSQILMWTFPKGSTTLVAFVANSIEKRGKSLTGSSESVALNAKSATSCNSAEILGLDRSTSSAISFSSSCRGCSDS